MSDDARAKQLGVTKMGLLFASLACCTVTLTIGNKFILKNWEYESTLLVIQCGSTVLILLACSLLRSVFGDGLPGWVPTMKPLSLQQFKVYIVASVFVTVQLITSLYGLPLVTIATVTVFQNLRTIATAIFESVLLREMFSVRVLLALCVTIGGSVVYGLCDRRPGGNYDATGYFWMFANVIAAVVAALVYRKFNPSVNQTGWGIALIENVNMLPVFAVLAMRETGAVTALIDADRSIWGALVMTSLAGTLIGSCYANCYKYAAATSVAVAATTNKCIAIVIGLFFFHKSLAPIQWLALVVIIVGGMWFGFERKAEQNSKKDAQQQLGELTSKVEYTGVAGEEHDLVP